MPFGYYLARMSLESTRVSHLLCIFKYGHCPKSGLQAGPRWPSWSTDHFPGPGWAGGVPALLPVSSVPNTLHAPARSYAFRLTCAQAGREVRPYQTMEGGAEHLCPAQAARALRPVTVWEKRTQRPLEPRWPTGGQEAGTGARGQRGDRSPGHPWGWRRVMGSPFQS